MEIDSAPDIFSQIDDSLSFEQPVDSELDNQTTHDSSTAIRYDVVDLNLEGYQIENFSDSHAEDGQIVSLRGTGEDSGSAEGFFSGPTGLYEVSVGYYDEYDGVSHADVTVNDKTSSFTLDRDLNGDRASLETFTTKVTHDSVWLESGAAFEIAGALDRQEFVRFDYIEFKPIGELDEGFAAESEEFDSSNSEIFDSEEFDESNDEDLPSLDSDIELEEGEESDEASDDDIFNSEEFDDFEEFDNSEEFDNQSPANLNPDAVANYPVIEQFAQAGVEGGIPNGRPIVATINPGDDIQAAINDASSAGGGVVLLKSGTYQVYSSINLEDNVTLRGEDRDSVVIASSIRSRIGEGWSSPGRKDSTIIFENDNNAGVENLTIEYQVPGLEPNDREGLADGGRCFECFTNDPYGRDDLHVRGIYISRNSNNNWVNGVSVLKSGTDPIVVEGDHNTLTNNFVDQSYNKGVNGAGYYTIAGDYNLVQGETVKRIRHFAVQGGAAYNVVTDSDFEVDINFHNGDDGNNLIQSNTIKKPSWRVWNAFETGGAQFGHDAPGGNNILFDNETIDYNADGSTETPFDSDVIYTFSGYGAPVETNWGIPAGGKFY